MAWAVAGDTPNSPPRPPRRAPTTAQATPPVAIMVMVRVRDGGGAACAPRRDVAALAAGRDSSCTLSSYSSSKLMLSPPPCSPGSPPSVHPGNGCSPYSLRSWPARIAPGLGELPGADGHLGPVHRQDDGLGVLARCRPSGEGHRRAQDDLGGRATGRVDLDVERRVVAGHRGAEQLGRQCDTRGQGG